jgi:hypothetical protein
VGFLIDDCPIVEFPIVECDRQSPIRNRHSPFRNRHAQSSIATFNRQSSLNRQSPLSIVNRHFQSSMVTLNRQSPLSIVNRHSQSAIATLNPQSSVTKSAIRNHQSAM